MKKKIYLSAAVLLIVAGVVGVTITLRNQNKTSDNPRQVSLSKPGEPSTVAQAKASAKAQANTPACLAANKQLMLTDSDKNGIEMGAASQLIDVPAGTETIVNVAAYDGKKATGSELYPKDYGTYNFTAEKDSSAPANNMYNWKITSFTACKSV